MKSKIIMITALAFAVPYSMTAYGEQTTGEKIENTADKATDSVKEGARNVSDKTCEALHGKENCVGGKLKHKAKTLKDKTKTKINEVKDKVD